MTPPTGEQYEITHGAYRAVVTQSGAALRLLTHDGVDLVLGFPEDEIPHRCRGQMLMPWPNRIRDGRYTWNGVEEQLALTEPARDNAIHGLVRWATFAPVERTASSITLGHRLMAQNGYPGILDVSVTFALDDGGLTITQAATNIGSTSAPYASGSHPYLTLPSGRVDDWTLQAPAATLCLSDERLLPTGTRPVEDTEYDFRAGRRLGSLQLDHCFADLARDADGIATVRLSDDDSAVELWLDETQPWLMVFSDDGDGPSREGVAVEPMTVPVDAFNTGEGVVELAPGASFSARWGIRVG